MTLSPQLAAALARRNASDRRSRAAAQPRAQSRFPHDFWLNFELGFALFMAQRRDEALGYYRAALALRPEAAEAYTNLGLVHYRIRDNWTRPSNTSPASPAPSSPN